MCACPEVPGELPAHARTRLANFRPPSSGDRSKLSAEAFWVKRLSSNIKCTSSYWLINAYGNVLFTWVNIELKIKSLTLKIASFSRRQSRNYAVVLTGEHLHSNTICLLLETITVEAENVSVYSYYYECCIWCELNIFFFAERNKVFRYVLWRLKLKAKC